MQSISPLFAVEAEKLLEEGKIAQAIELCRRGLEEYPGYAAGTMALAKALAAAGKAEEAKREIEAARAESSGFKAFNAPLTPEVPYDAAYLPQDEDESDFSDEELTEEDFSSLNTQANEEILLENFSEETEILPEGIEDTPENPAPESIDEEVIPTAEAVSNNLNDDDNEWPSDIEFEAETSELNEAPESEIPEFDEAAEEASSEINQEEANIVEDTHEDLPGLEEIEDEIPIDAELEIEQPVSVENSFETPEIEEIEDEIPTDAELEIERPAIDEALAAITEDIEFDNVAPEELQSEDVNLKSTKPKYVSISEKFDLIEGLEFFRYEGKFHRADFSRGLQAEAFNFRTPGDIEAMAATLRYATVPASTQREEIFDEEPPKAPPFMTETIANLYVLQGELEQAHEAFVRLSETAQSAAKAGEYAKKAEELKFQIEMRKPNE